MLYDICINSVNSIYSITVIGIKSGLFRFTSQVGASVHVSNHTGNACKEERATNIY